MLQTCLSVHLLNISTYVHPSLNQLTIKKSWMICHLLYPLSPLVKFPMSHYRLTTLFLSFFGLFQHFPNFGAFYPWLCLTHPYFSVDLVNFFLPLKVCWNAILLVGGLSRSPDEVGLSYYFLSQILKMFLQRTSELFLSSSVSKWFRKIFLLQAMDWKKASALCEQVIVLPPNWQSLTPWPWQVCAGSVSASAWVPLPGHFVQDTCAALRCQPDNTFHNI